MVEKKNEVNQYVIFKLGEEVFGTKISNVREIVIYQESTKLPGTKDYVDGVVNLRGHVIPVLNLRSKFGMDIKEVDKDTRIVVMEIDDAVLGVVVDEVSEVLMVSGDLIQEPSSIITSSVDANFINGIAKMEEKLIILLDVTQFIRLDEINVAVEQVI